MTSATPSGDDKKPKEPTMQERARGTRVALSALMVIPLVVMGAIALVSEIGSAPEGSRHSRVVDEPPDSLETASASARVVETSSKSNWPINQAGVDLSASGAPGSQPKSLPDPEPVAGDNGLAGELAGVGIGEDAIRTLGALGMETGYLWTSRSPTMEEMLTFAYMSVLECQEVAGGMKTWEQSAAEAVASGAAPSDAQRMVMHLENSFCP